MCRVVNLPLVLVYLQKVTAENKRLAFLQAIERHLFVLSLFGRYYRQYFSPSYPHNIPDLSIELNTGKLNADKVIRHITDETASILKVPEFVKEVQNWFRSNGFYEWVLIRYFLFEYNSDLQTRSKTEREKIFWSEFTEQKEDFISVEHIYPQQARHEYWTTRFSGLSQKQRTALRNSLGNLLPLSKPKNSSLSNKPFNDKVAGIGNSTNGYCYGCYAENEVARCSDWTPQEILQRGLTMLNFMEKRWNLDFGDKTQKQYMLGVEFLLPP